MRIVLIHNYYERWTGEETYFESLVKLLKKKGHEVRKYTKDNKDIKSFRQKINASLGLFWNRDIEKELSKLITNFRPDVVQFQNIYPLITPSAYKIVKRFDIPIIQRVSNYRFICPKATLFRDGKVCELCIRKKFTYPAIFYSCYHKSRMASMIFSLAMFFHRFIFKSFNYIDTYIYPTKFISNYFSNDIPGFYNTKSKIIPTFVKKQSSDTIASDKKYFLYVGWLSEEKGIIPLLKIFRDLKKQKLIVIGHGQLKEKVNQYKKYSNIVVIDFLPRHKVIAYMRNATALIIPSLWFDVLPNVLLESMSVGTPVIAPHIAAFRDVIENGKTGFLYGYANYEELKQIILKVGNTKQIDKRVLIGEFKKKYTENFHYSNLLKLYHSVINKYKTGVN